MTTGTRLDRSNRSKLQEILGVPDVNTRGNICIDTVAGDLYLKYGELWVEAGAASNTTLDDAYDNFTGAAVVSLGVKDLTWECGTKFSFIIDLQKAGANYGFHVVDGANYFKLDHIGTGKADLLASLYSVTIASMDHICLMPGIAFGIGTLAPTAFTDIEYEGTVSDDTALLEICNSANASSMANTETSLVWKQYYYNAITPDEAYSGKITVGTTGSWDATTRTQNSYMALSVISKGDWVEGMRILNTGFVGFGTTNPTCHVEIRGDDGVKSVQTYLKLTNASTAEDMDGTGTCIQFDQWYYDVSSPSYRTAGRIEVATETDWTAPDAGSNAYMAFYTALNGADLEKVRLTSGGNWCIGLTDCAASATHTLGLKNGTAPGAHVDNAIQIYSVDTDDNTATLGLYLEQAIEAIGTFSPDYKVKIVINGTPYWVQLEDASS